MTLDVTREQFENLLKLAYLGQWMANGIRTEDDKVKKFTDIAQLLYAYAHEEGFDSFVDADGQAREFLPGMSLENDGELEDLKNFYNEEIFWGELTERLAGRDFVNAYGDDALMTMSPEEQRKRKSDFLKTYAEEFEKNGIEHLTL